MTTLGETQAFVGTLRNLEAALGRQPLGYLGGCDPESAGVIWYAYADGRLGCESLGFATVDAALAYAKRQPQLTRIVDTREAWRAPMLTNRQRAI